MKQKEYARIGLGFLFQGLVRCFDDGLREKRAWQQDLNTELNAELEKESVAQEKLIFLKHYILCLVQLYLSQNLNFLELSNDNVDLPKDPDLSEEIVQRCREFQHDARLAFSFAYMDLAMEEKGFDESLAHRIARKLISRRTLGDSQSYYLIDLPLNCYLFDSPDCAIEYISCAVQNRILTLSHYEREESKKSGNSPFVILSLYREAMNIFEQAIKNFKIGQIISEYKQDLRVRQGDDFVERQFEFKELRISFLDMRFKIFRELAKEIIDSKGAVERAQTVRIVPRTFIDNNSLSEYLEFAVGDCCYDFFKSEAGIEKSSGIITIISGQFMRILETEYSDELDRSNVSGKFDTAEYVASEYLFERYGFERSNDSIYDQYLKVKNKEYNLIVEKWRDLLGDPTIISAEGWFLKQSIVGNMEYMELKFMELP